MMKRNLKDITMNEKVLKVFYNNRMYPGDTNLQTLIPRLVSIHNCTMGGILWVCFFVNDNKSSYFDMFGGPPDKLLLKQLPKTLTFHNFKSLPCLAEQSNVIRKTHVDSSSNDPSITEKTHKLT